MQELFEIREELKKSGLALYNRKVLASNSNLSKINNQSSNDFLGYNDQPKPMMFVCYTFFIFINENIFLKFYLFKDIKTKSIE